MKGGKKLIACAAVLFVSAAAMITSGLVVEKRNKGTPAVEIIEVSRTAQQAPQETEYTLYTSVGSGDSGMININTASAEELESLDGIGEKLAAAIIEYRSETPFESVDDIVNVKGIGEKKLEAIRDSICV